MFLSAAEATRTLGDWGIADLVGTLATVAVPIALQERQRYLREKAAENAREAAAELAERQRAAAQAAADAARAWAAADRERAAAAAHAALLADAPPGVAGLPVPYLLAGLAGLAALWLVSRR